MVIRPDVQETLMEVGPLARAVAWRHGRCYEYKGGDLSLLSPSLQGVGGHGQSVRFTPSSNYVIGLYGWLVLRMKKQAVERMETLQEAMVGLRNWANALAKGHLKSRCMRSKRSWPRFRMDRGRPLVLVGKPTPSGRVAARLSEGYPHYARNPPLEVVLLDYPSKVSDGSSDYDLRESAGIHPRRVRANSRGAGGGMGAVPHPGGQEDPSFWRPPWGRSWQTVIGTALACWAFYSVVEALVHVLPEDAFIEVRTNRNRDKITKEETATLRNKTVGIAGLTGQSTAIALAMELDHRSLKLADFDVSACPT